MLPVALKNVKVASSLTAVFWERLTVILYQLRCQIHFIRGERPKLKCFQDIFSQWRCRHLVRSPATEDLPRSGVYVIDDEVNIPLGKIFASDKTLGGWTWTNLPETMVGSSILLPKQKHPSRFGCGQSTLTIHIWSIEAKYVSSVVLCLPVGSDRFLQHGIPRHQTIEFKSCHPARIRNGWYLLKDVLKVVVGIHSVQLGCLGQRIDHRTGWGSNRPVGEQPVLLVMLLST